MIWIISSFICGFLIGIIFMELRWTFISVGTFYGTIDDENGNTLLVDLKRDPRDFQNQKRIYLDVKIKNSRR